MDALMFLAEAMAAVSGQIGIGDEGTGLQGGFGCPGVRSMSTSVLNLRPPTDAGKRRRRTLMSTLPGCIPPRCGRHPPSWSPGRDQGFVEKRGHHACGPVIFATKYRSHDQQRAGPSRPSTSTRLLPRAGRTMTWTRIPYVVSSGGG